MQVKWTVLFANEGKGHIVCGKVFVDGSSHLLADSQSELVGLV